MMAMMTTDSCCQVHARHNISLDQQRGNQLFDQVAAAVTPTKLASAYFIGSDTHQASQRMLHPLP